MAPWKIDEVGGWACGRGRMWAGGGGGGGGVGGHAATLCLPNSSRMKADRIPSSCSCVLDVAFNLSVSTMNFAERAARTMNFGERTSLGRLDKWLQKHSEFEGM